MRKIKKDSHIRINLMVSRNVNIFNDRVLEKKTYRHIALKYNISVEYARCIILRMLEFAIEQERSSHQVARIYGSLSVRLSNGLREHNINTLGDLYKVTEEEALSWKNVGKKSVIELKEFLRHNGMTFKSKDNPPYKQNLTLLPLRGLFFQK